MNKLISVTQRCPNQYVVVRMTKHGKVTTIENRIKPVNRRYSVKDIRRIKQ